MGISYGHEWDVIGIQPMIWFVKTHHEIENMLYHRQMLSFTSLMGFVETRGAGLKLSKTAKIWQTEVGFLIDWGSSCTCRGPVALWVWRSSQSLASDIDNLIWRLDSSLVRFIIFIQCCISSSPMSRTLWRAVNLRLESRRSMHIFNRYFDVA